MKGASVAVGWTLEKERNTGGGWGLDEGREKNGPERPTCLFQDLLTY